MYNEKKLSFLPQISILNNQSENDNRVFHNRNLKVTILQEDQKKKLKDKIAKISIINQNKDDLRDNLFSNNLRRSLAVKPIQMKEIKLSNNSSSPIKKIDNILKKTIPVNIKSKNYSTMMMLNRYQSKSQVNHKDKKYNTHSLLNYGNNKGEDVETKKKRNNTQNNFFKINTNYFAHMKKPSRKIHSMEIINIAKSSQVSLNFNKTIELEEFLSKHNIKNSYNVMVQKHNQSQKIAQNYFSPKKDSKISTLKKEVKIKNQEIKNNMKENFAKLDFSEIEEFNNVKEVEDDLSFELNLSKIENKNL